MFQYLLFLVIAGLAILSGNAEAHSHHAIMLFGVTTLTALKPSIIAKEALMRLKNNLVMAKLVHTDYKKEFVKVGDTVTARKPNKFASAVGANIVLNDIAEPSVPVKIDTQRHVAWDWSSVDLTLVIDEFGKRYLEPAMATLANDVDLDLANAYKNLFTAVGTPGTAPATFAALVAAPKALDLNGVPAEDRFAMLDPAAYWALADGLTGKFQQNLVGDILRKGWLGRIAELDIYKNQNVRTHIAGTRTNGTVSGAAQTGSTLVLAGLGAAGTVKKGDIFTAAGCYQVNPIGKQVYGNLQQFTVTADAVADGVGAATVSISPAITVIGPHQTVSASPTNGGAVTWVAGHTANIVAHKNAIGLVVRPLEVPEGTAWAAEAADPDTGLSIRVIKAYDITTDRQIIRLDILYGVVNLYPELGCRLMG